MKIESIKRTEMKDSPGTPTKIELQKVETIVPPVPLLQAQNLVALTDLPVIQYVRAQFDYKLDEGIRRAVRLVLDFTTILKRCEIDGASVFVAGEKGRGQSMFGCLRMDPQNVVCSPATNSAYARVHTISDVDASEGLPASNSSDTSKRRSLPEPIRFIL
jgi:hypothetical protein